MKDFRLYAITGEEFHSGRSMVDVMEKAILGGVDIIQLRDKKSSKLDVLKKAQKLRKLTEKHQVTFIVNDHIDVALAVGADGIHVGQDDLPLDEVRKIVGPDMIIGISTHHIDEAKAAEQGGADYIGVGPIFPTNSKEDVVDPVTTTYIQQIEEEITIPYVAIGGIKRHNLKQVMEAGARRVCMITEIVQAEDVQARCEEIIQIMDEQKEALS
ncbi:thiamine phosphate synthase [Alkalicoccobacillus murimartini]|uniref:Thiamine-phosphate synthase n=1 Tax=Alkalicoccobacillus murimartini TaxID=171685 RepID=A0ABT9YEW1_9BACI|nr:thiamine phosphate synthase [Alkalicoccobacillus murimartini]MDQ0205604.1 thiamine-phosphate pyrophosphorylase [Alkalicoccobacillus murimartini]